MASDGVPAAAELREAERNLKAEDDKVAAADEKLRIAQEKLAELDAALDDERLASSVVSDDEIAATRAERERLWSAHRSALKQDTADAFEAAMREDDDVRGRHATSAEGRVRRARMKADRMMNAADAERRETDLESARERRIAPTEIVKRLATRLGLDADIAPSAFGDTTTTMSGRTRRLEIKRPQKRAGHLS